MAEFLKLPPMIKVGGKKLNPMLLLAGLLSLATLLLILFSPGTFPKSLKARIEKELQEDFLQRVHETEARSLEYLAKFGEDEALSDEKGVVRLLLDSKCDLIRWTNSEQMPSARTLPDLCTFPNMRVLDDRNKVYYLMRHEAESHTLVTLVPIHISYKVENSFLPPYIFLGRYENDPNVQSRKTSFDVHYRQMPGTIKVSDEQGNFIFSLHVPDVEIFTYRYKSYVLGTGVLALFVWLFVLLKGVRGRRFKIGNWSIRQIWIAIPILLGLRILLFVLGLPNAYRPLELFSPAVLAIDNWSPSLGDLALNVGLMLVIIRLIITEYRRKISRLFKWALQKETLAWTVQCLTLTVCGLFTWWFFRLTDSIILNSTIYFEFSNLFELDFYSYIAFAILAAVLIGLQLILLELLRFSFHFFRGPGLLHKSLLSLAFLGGLSFLLFGFQTAYLISVPLVFVLSLLVFMRTKRTLVFKLDLLNFLILISIFSLLTTIGIAEGTYGRMEREMERLADRQSDDHDLITESLFERVVQEVEGESFLLDYREAEGLGVHLRENFFETNFKGYEVRIFVYDKDFNLLDRTTPSAPYLPPDSTFTLEQLGRSTMTDNLYMVPHYTGLFESIYIGKFDLLLRSLGNIRVLVELEPTEIQSNQLYPQLLLDDKVRSKAVIPNEFEYAVYRDGQLFRKKSNESFPIFFNGPEVGDSLRIIHEIRGKYDHLYLRVNETKLVHVRTPRRGLLDFANQFSFIFYFFILGTILLMMPVWVLRLVRKPALIMHLSLKGKIQVFFLSISVLPLFVVVFLLSPYIKAHIYRDLRNELLAETNRIASQLREDYLELRQNRIEYLSLEKLLESRMQEMEKTLLNDINIYYHTGRLHLTTQPAIYELGLTSEFMNPNVFRQIRNWRVSDMVIEDEIGNINYFSGYSPIYTNGRKIIGYLNIPYFKNQDQVNAQSLDLLTLLVNIYVFIFLAIGILAVLVSNSIIRPLGILSKELRSTNLGRRNKPIEWKTKDEIGEIIEAYNSMVQKLEASEEKLARNQREMAWKEMASQVAHEIKNPLTPMRLSVQHLQQVWKRDRPDNERLDRMFQKVTGTVLIQIEQLVNIANSFSQFSKMPEPKRERFLLADVVEGVVDLYSHSEDFRLEVSLLEEEFWVNADRDQLSRVFNNLVKNAHQAIEHEEGMVKVKMTVEGDEVLVSVTDNGKGIPEAIRSRIFEPKFTTKDSGMGLGLAMVKRIVESVDGNIWFETEEGQGTTFFVRLPRDQS